MVRSSGRESKGRKGRKGMRSIGGDGPIAVQFSASELGLPGTSTVEVGYKAPYAVFVEGNDRAKHTTGQAHFLGQPAASLSQAMAIEAQQAIAEGASRREALLDAGDLLLGASQAVVPVDTGLLRDSGYVTIRRGKTVGIGE
jgi:hypothetical protein